MISLEWHFSSEGERLLRPELLDLTQLVEQRRAIIQKDGEHRTVYRVEAPTLSFYWKHCKLNGPRAWARDILRGAKAKIEFQQLERLIQAEIPTIQPLAWAQSTGHWPRGSMLLTLAVPNAIPLSDYLATQKLNVQQRREIAHVLGRFLARLHTKGFIHTDLHPGNILIDRNQPLLDWRLIDVHDLQVKHRPLNEREIVDNLVMINRWFSMRANQTDRLAFWQEYQAITHVSKQLSRTIEAETVRSNRELWCSRDTRAVTNNRDFQRWRANCYRGYATREINDEILVAIANPERLFQTPSTRIIKDSRTSKVAIIQLGETKYILKRFNIKRAYTPLANLVRPSPAIRSWIGAYALSNRNIPTPRNHVVLHRYRFGLPCEAYLLTEFLPDSQTLDLVTFSPELRDATARLIAKMHSTGICHRDLKAANLLRSQGQLYLIDLVGLERQIEVSVTRCQRDLTRFYVSSISMPAVTHTQRLRWIKCYLAQNKHDPATWKVWWKAIAARSLDKLAKNKLNQRAIS